MPNGGGNGNSGGNNGDDDDTGNDPNTGNNPPIIIIIQGGWIGGPPNHNDNPGGNGGIALDDSGYFDLSQINDFEDHCVASEVNYFKASHENLPNAADILIHLRNYCDFEDCLDYKNGLRGFTSCEEMPECVKAILRSANMATLANEDDLVLSAEEYDAIFGNLCRGNFSSYKKTMLINYMKNVGGFGSSTESQLNSMNFKYAVRLYQYLNAGDFSPEIVDHAVAVVGWVAGLDFYVDDAQFGWLLENSQIFEEIFKNLEDQEIIEEIFDLLLKHNLHLPCNPEVTSEAIIASVIDNENFKSNPGVEIFYQVLAEEEDYIIEDASFENCSYAQCIYGKILGSNNPVNCALIDPLFNDDDFGLALHLSDKQYSYTTFDNESNMANMFIRLKCNGNNENDLEVAATIVHEMIHAEIMMTLFGLGLDPNNLQSFDEAWDNYQLDYMLNLQDMYDLNDIHHAVMVFVEGDNDVPGGGAVDRIAKILWELNGRQLTIEHYYHIAWGGLRYIDSQWAEDEYGTNSAYYTLHQELLISNPNLSLGC